LGITAAQLARAGASRLPRASAHLCCFVISRRTVGMHPKHEVPEMHLNSCRSSDRHRP